MDQQTGVQAQIARGDTLLKRGNVREAAEEFAGVVRAEPGTPLGILGWPRPVSHWATSRRRGRHARRCSNLRRRAPRAHWRARWWRCWISDSMWR